jgi:hypothetical protein
MVLSLALLFWLSHATTSIIAVTTTFITCRPCLLLVVRREIGARELLRCIFFLKQWMVVEKVVVELGITGPVPARSPGHQMWTFCLQQS